MAKNNNFKIGTLKYKAYQLRKNYQIPYQLMLYIEDISSSTNPRVVSLLMSLTEHYLRVKNYYKKYPHAEYECNVDIESTYNKMMSSLSE